MVLPLTPSRFATIADLYKRFGSMPLDRIRFNPWPGTATEEDVVEVNEKGEARCELVDGTLLEKPVGNYESYLAIELAAILRAFVKQHGLGVVLGADSMFRLFGGRVRLPDVSFVSRQRMAGYDMKRDPVAPFGPDLAAEVISRSNTEQEMDEKLDDYFAHDVRLVWYVYPASEEVHIYTARHSFTVKRKAEVLDGGDVLPGFTLSLSEFFELPRYE